MVVPKMKMYAVPENGRLQRRWTGMRELKSLNLHGLQKQHFAIPEGCVCIFFFFDATLQQYDSIVSYLVCNPL